ncbi:coiled-coil domain-containing protein 157-like isoform X3 [Sceloporus undulatus]|uniref:coiled-coil domain-containing protein 157-like isoform X3 n=1 Tax=Sceloporus undulatus TaxID=8520 RepID=UPI001C4A7EB3|nr:coiled-coil domain-containing protein 157-like isoform X3 [Sceloporus undulatus]
MPSTEQAKGDLLQEMRTKMVDKAEVESREKRLEVLAGQLEAVKRQLGLATTELDKEKAKVESVLRHKESLQAKQRALTQQLDRLDQECEQLRAGLADSEEVHVLMKESMKEMQEGRQQTQHRLEEQQRLTEKAEQEKLRMEQCTTELQRTISELGELVQETKKRERLLVLYPDLHVPVEAHFEGTGDVMEDMGKQLRANNIRISVLEEENTRLRSALARMEEATLLREETKIMPPTQLWITSDADDPYENGVPRSPMG